MNLGLVLGAILFLGAFYSWTSRINGLFFFGRTVDPELRASDAGRGITRKYLLAIVASTVAAALVAWAGAHVRPSLDGAGIIVEGCAFFLLFARANRAVRELAEGHRSPAAAIKAAQVSLLEPPAYWVPGLAAALLPGCLSLATVATAVLLTPAAGIAAQWTLLSNNLEAHRLDGLFGMTVGGVGGALLLLLSFRTSARLRTPMAQYTVRSSMVMAWLGAVLMAAVLFVNARGLALSQHVVRTTVLAVVSAALGTVIWNQARHKRFVPPSVEMGADDRWRWGLFYLDRADPALFVQSRCGAGYSLNYGKVAAWPITLVIWGYLLTMLFVAPHHH